MSMKNLIVAALEHELDSRRRDMQGQPISFPLVPSRKPRSHELKPEQISDILVREEAAAYEAADRR